MKQALLFNRAVELRQNGYSLNQIHENLGIAKSTTSLWLRNIKVGKSAFKKIQHGTSEGRLRGRMKITARRIARENLLKQLVSQELSTINLDDVSVRLLCSFLYWAEGSKSKDSVCFTNSDPRMVAVYLKLLRNGFDIDEKRLGAWLHLHQYHDRQEMLKFWSGVTSIPVEQIKIYNKPNSGKNIRPGYPGCISVRFNDVKTFHQITFYYQIFSDLYMGA